MAGPVTWSFTADSHITGATIWGEAATPAVPSAQNDSSAIEVGVKFRVAVAGSIVGIRFYKGAGNTGTHVGHLWTAAGTLLASVTFTERDGHRLAAGHLLRPRSPIAANTTYIVSYYAPNGHYAVRQPATSPPAG